MNVPSNLRRVSILVCVLAATSGFSQNLPAIPPSHDPAFWGRPNAPYALKLTETSTSSKENSAPQRHVSEMNVYRDSAGRVCTEAFYDNGRPMSVLVRDPVKSTTTFMGIVDKRAFVVPLLRPVAPSAGMGWVVERLPSRIIDGLPAEGLRFKRSIPAAAERDGVPDTVIDEEWISNTLGVVLEQKVESQRTGTTTRTVAHFKQVEPDPTLFRIPSDYHMDGQKSQR